ncbi:hypothetical protein GCM10011529_29270 [Polymorphobacter glacialis]|uniref:Uncharacterized protein n=1 Tax=Sandarakinorhabdus glacialis TaxID=1614636 RepID=A0A917EBU4_9SPHN|nr:hypothetical protein [Polymorphobacter glacialis]GGE20764.1 hypothetical protein GCM10011529_29270 [Polymorphobacter glacialis]
MNDLRIRSEAGPDPVWPQAFRPAPAGAAARDEDDSDFGPLMIAVGRALGVMFGAVVEVLPGRPPRAVGNEVVPEVAPVLAGLLATVQFGGDVARVSASSAGGVAVARQARAIADAVAAVAARVWPMGSTRAGFDLDVAVGGVAGHVRVTAPVVAEAEPVPVAAASTRLFDLPMRVRVELSGAMVMAGSLLPLRAGAVLPIEPCAEMPLLLGNHHIGRATVLPLTDGRQQASITALGVMVVPGIGGGGRR